MLNLALTRISICSTVLDSFYTKYETNEVVTKDRFVGFTSNK